MKLPDILLLVLTISLLVLTITFLFLHFAGYIPFPIAPIKPIIL